MRFKQYPRAAFTDFRAFIVLRKLIVFAVGFFILFTATTQASAETRTLRMYYGHSKESATITFKKNGKYIKSGLRKANRFLRDWRRKEPTRMDPKLLDLVWEVYKKSGSRKPIQVISGYRSPRTNKMLRRRGRKVARNSQHTRGKALDFFMPDVSVKKLRALGLKAHGGGVGYYRGSFVHLDTGRVRHWPRMSRKQLSRVFPRGRTIHIPSNGRPLKGYKVAAANLKRGRNADGSRRRSGGRAFALAKPKPKKDVVKVAKVEKPKVVKAAKTKGSDPFSQDSSAVSKAEKNEAEKKKLEIEKKKLEEQRKKDEAEAILLAKSKAEDAAKASQLAKAEELAKRAAEATQTAKLSPADVATPKLRPAVEPSTQLALASTGNAAASNVLEPVGATELALAAPPAVKPSALVPSTKSLASSLSNSEVAALSSRAAELLSRQRKLAEEAQKALNIPANQPKKPAKTIVAAVKPKNDPVVVLPKEIVQAPRANQELVVAKLEDAPKPSWRSETIANTANVPAVAEDKTIVAAIVEAVLPASSDPVLELGDLDGSAVKEWAVALSTRVGPVGRLTAPVYKQGTSRIAPSSVYSSGFVNNRQPLRADRFSGRALTRVAFAHFGTTN